MSRPGARGFVLVGVVMMVLALTIIGLSLYSLSGYESQFFGRSLFDRQALYAAQGGVELAKAMLSTPLGSPPEYGLSNVSRVIGREGIVSALAWQEDPPDTAGPIDWSRNVHVRVGVVVNGVQRTVEGEFSGGVRRSPYDHLFTCPTAIVNVNPTPGINRPTILVGKVWQTVTTASDTAWTQSLDDDSRVQIIPEQAPSPASAAFLTSNGPGDLAPISWEETPPTTYLDMDAGSDTDARFFRSPPDERTTHHTTMSPYFDFFSQRRVIVRVRGTAIWLVPRGTQIEGEFIVRRLAGATTGTLVMVVGPNERYVYPAPFTAPGEDNRQYGPIFENGIRLENTSLFLVSHGIARIKRPYAGPEAVANGISVFAQRIEFEGPEYGDPRKDMRLEYPAWLEPIAQSLTSRGLLPGATGVASGEWTLRSGTWTTSPGLQ